MDTHPRRTRTSPKLVMKTMQPARRAAKRRRTRATRRRCRAAARKLRNRAACGSGSTAGGSTASRPPTPLPPTQAAPRATLKEIWREVEDVVVLVQAEVNRSIRAYEVKHGAPERAKGQSLGHLLEAPQVGNGQPAGRPFPIHPVDSDELSHLLHDPTGLPAAKEGISAGPRGARPGRA